MSGTSHPLTVTALDAEGNTSTAYTGTVHLTSTDPLFVNAGGDLRLTNGTGTFNVVLKTAGNQTITATDTAKSSIAGTSNTVTVVPGQATRLLVSAPSSVSAGTPFSFTVTAVDAANNTVTDYSGTVHFFSTDPAASLPPDSVLVNGTKTFSATLNTAGPQLIGGGDSLISGGSPAITVTGADLILAITHTGNFSQGQIGAAYMLTATNSGVGPTTGAVQVAVSPLPSGFTATGLAGTGWSCTLATLTCSRSDVLAAGGSYPAITLTVNVAGNAGSPLTVRATVSGGGEANLSNDTAADPTTINAIVNESANVRVTQNGFGRNRSTGLWSATLTVTNIGSSTLPSPLQVVFNQLPPGVTMVNNTGTRNGSPYLTVLPSGSLPPGASISATIQFSNPNNVVINFTPETDLGVF